MERRILKFPILGSCRLHPPLDIFCTYEQHFGLSGPPFATTPDPDFYFESRAHRRAFAYLRHAVLEGECVMVLTGDIGTGKTMLVRKLLGGLESERIVAVQLAGTVADAPELLHAVLAAFRVPAIGNTLEELRAGLHAFLTTLESSGRRGLVVVDEAQHLPQDAIEELLQLAKSRATSSSSPTQVLLAGHPRLRTSLENAARTTREAVFLFCDIGLLSESETRSYVEHRLHHVGWDRSPSFADDAHRQIHRATNGVPRRINRLCHRLLMAASRQQLGSISPALVDETDAGLRDEMGDSPTTPVANPAAAYERPVPVAGMRVRPSRGAISTLFTASDYNAQPAERSETRSTLTEDDGVPTLITPVDENRHAINLLTRPELVRRDYAVRAPLEKGDDDDEEERLNSPVAKPRDSAIPTLFTDRGDSSNADISGIPITAIRPTIYGFVRNGKIRASAMLIGLSIAVLVFAWFIGLPAYLTGSSPRVAVSAPPMATGVVTSDEEASTKDGTGEPAERLTGSTPSADVPPPSAGGHAVQSSTIAAVSPEALPAARPNSSERAAPVHAKPTKSSGPRTPASSTKSSGPRTAANSTKSWGPRTSASTTKSSGPRTSTNSGKKSKRAGLTTTTDLGRTNPPKPAPSLGPCTPAVAALGLCTTSKNP